MKNVCAAFFWYSSSCVNKYISLEFFIMLLVHYIYLVFQWYFCDFLVRIWYQGFLLYWWNNIESFFWIETGLIVLNGLNIDFLVSRGLLLQITRSKVTTFFTLFWSFSCLALFFNYSEMVSDISHSFPKSLSELLSPLLARYNLGWGCSFLANVGGWGVQLVLGHVSLLGNCSINLSMSPWSGA